MGYYVNVEINNIVIPSDKVDACLAVINELFTRELKEKRHINKYIGVEEPRDGCAPSLADAFMCWGYSAIIEVNDCITLESFDKEKWGDDEILYTAIAPFVQDNENATITCRGEDDALWRYVFKNGKIKEEEGKIIWS